MLKCISRLENYIIETMFLLNSYIIIWRIMFGEYKIVLYENNLYLYDRPHDLLDMLIIPYQHIHNFTTHIEHHDRFSNTKVYCFEQPPA